MAFEKDIRYYDVPRLYVMFRAEDPEVFAQRIMNAVQRRYFSENRIKWVFRHGSSCAVVYVPVYKYFLSTRSFRSFEWFWSEKALPAFALLIEGYTKTPNQNTVVNTWDRTRNVPNDSRLLSPLWRLSLRLVSKAVGARFNQTWSLLRGLRRVVCSNVCVISSGSAVL